MIFRAVMTLATLLLILVIPSLASESSEEMEYRRAIEARSERIVETLDLASRERHARVVQIVAEQYRALRDAHAKRDAKLEQATGNKQPVKDHSFQEVVTLHRRFLGRLAAELTAQQVVQIKDGMTYGVAPNTFKAYCELLPDLTEEQKRVILANLLEAREHAMDAGSSKEKHGWFGKYKGRINNFLSSHGYDLKQAERDLAQRRQAAE